MRQQNGGVQHRVNRREFNTSKEKKFRSWVSNTCDHNAFMMIDKEHEAERITKVYKEINKECEEWRVLVQHWNDEKQKKSTNGYHSKIYIQMDGRSTYLKLLPAITFIQSCWQQVRAKKEPLTN
jgi:hypothetical protein